MLFHFSLRATLIICLRIVGDTTCRKELNLLELVMENDVVVIGRVNEIEGSNFTIFLIFLFLYPATFTTLNFVYMQHSYSEC